MSDAIMSVTNSTIECVSCGIHAGTIEDKKEHASEKHSRLRNKPDNWKDKANKWADAML
ncbi:MAG: hypothetical protein ACXAEB_02885 [Candidatus Thorarchaeota archaeon]|jgi:hypothetical protein